MIFGGLGLALANWLSVLVEEAELHRVLGETYRSYARDRARLVPHAW